MLGNGMNLTHQRTLESEMEIRPITVGSSGLLDPLQEFIPILDEDIGQPNVSLPVLVSEHKLLHDRMQEGKRELGEIALAVRRQRELVNLGRNQAHLRVVGYSTGGGLIVLAAVLVIIGVCFKCSTGTANKRTGETATQSVSLTVPAPPGPIFAPIVPPMEVTSSLATSALEIGPEVSFSPSSIVGPTRAAV